MEGAAPHLKPVILELGGKVSHSHAADLADGWIVTDDADNVCMYIYLTRILWW